MNISIIRYILGHVLKIEAIFLVLPLLVSIYYGESAGFSFLITIILCLIAGTLLTLNKPASQVFYLKDGCVATSLSWILLSIFGALPFYISGEIPSFTDSLFETISGFTTTGSSILNDIEALSNCMLFWRSFTNWIGGMGVLVFLLAIIPLSGGSNINLMRAESPGPSVGKLVPTVKDTARLLYYIYIGLTVLHFVTLLFSGIGVFESINIAFSTAGTGGFGIKNDSLASYSPYVQWNATIFMILFGVNFNAYYLIIFKKLRKALTMEEVKYYFIIIFVATLITFFNIYNQTSGAMEALRFSAFHVASTITSTGYSVVDFDLWNSTAKMVFVLLVFIGACAGSTGGGIKVSRCIVAFKSIKKEINSYIHPKLISKIKLDGRPVENEVIHSISIYFITFIFIFIGSIFIVSLEGKDLITNFTAVATALNNNGPGLGLVGPTKNFSHFTMLTKYTLMFDMLAGRLELFPLLLLFHPANWKELFKRN